VQFPIIPLVISTALGAADGVLAGADTKAGRVTITKQRTLWLQGGAFLLGVVGEFMKWHPDLTEPLMNGSALLFTREVGYKLYTQNMTSPGPPAPQGWTAYAHVPPAQRQAALPAYAAGYAAPQAAYPGERTPLGSRI
jgi:hypothetical protein